MRPTFCRVWKERGVDKWSWTGRPKLMIPEQRPSLVMVQNAKGHDLSAGPGLSFTRVGMDGVRQAKVERAELAAAIV